ncbi:MinD/ParA family protein [Actinomadura sp. 3N508]|uniref:MinD/ParA family protein n=1 Tax=Actinomadura sp. 3N508 TaxID=3375153 RepID=UPI0037BAE832
MSDSTWQQAVLRDLGVSQRGLQVLATVPSSAAQEAWGAEAPPQPAPEQRAAAAPVVMPDPPAQPLPPTEPHAAPEPTPPPPPPPPAPFAAPSQGGAEAPPPPPPPPPPRPAFPAPGQEDPPAPPPAPPFLQQPVAGEAAEQPADASPEQQAPPPEFDWAAAVNPLIGVDTSEAPLAEQVGTHQPAAPPPEAAAQAPAPGQVGPVGAGQPIPAEDLIRKHQHGDPLARRMGRSVRKAVGGGTREARDMAAFVDLMQRPVPSTRQIAVASVRGGAGKTTMAALVSTELARHRRDRVLAADADAELGSLPLRLGVRPQLSLFDLAGQNPRSFEEAARFLAPTPEGLLVLSSTRGGRIAGEFTLEMFQNAVSQVARYVGTTVIDCGAGILTELNRGVVAASHGLVLVTPGTVDGALSARGALEWYAANNQRDLLARTVIAMVSHAPQVGADLQRAQQMLAAWGLPVVPVPYDRHLATGGSLNMSMVSAAARAAVTQIVHEVFARSLGAGG